MFDYIIIDNDGITDRYGDCTDNGKRIYFIIKLMKQTEYSVQIIEAEEGKTLTQAADVTLQERVFSKKLYLAVNDSPDNWKEITDEEAATLKAEAEAAARAAKEAVESSESVEQSTTEEDGNLL